MTEKKDTGKKENLPVKGKGGYKRKHQLNKDEVQEVLDMFESNRDLNGKDISKKYGCSVSQGNNLINTIRQNTWKPVKENDDLPKGYMIPKTLKEVVDSVMYDKGYIRK